MKLLYCLSCHDAFTLRTGPRVCECGKTTGCISTGNIQWSGPAKFIGIDGRSLMQTLMIQEEHGDRPDGGGRPVSAFIVPDGSPKIPVPKRENLKELRRKIQMKDG